MSSSQDSQHLTAIILWAVFISRVMPTCTTVGCSISLLCVVRATLLCMFSICPSLILGHFSRIMAPFIPPSGGHFREMLLDISIHTLTRCPIVRLLSISRATSTICFHTSKCPCVTIRNFPRDTRNTVISPDIGFTGTIPFSTGSQSRCPSTWNSCRRGSR